MDTNDRIHTELLKRLKIFSETYVPDKSDKKHKNKNYNHSPIICPKSTLFQKLPLNDEQKLSTFSNLKSKYKLYNIICQLKNDHKKHYTKTPKNNYHYKNNQLLNNFYGKNKIYKDVHHKPQNKPVKINLVNQKFKIADDFNEKNSNQFLNEKDECLKKITLTDEIEENEFTHFKNEE